MFRKRLRRAVTDACGRGPVRVSYLLDTNAVIAVRRLLATLLHERHVSETIELSEPGVEIGNHRLK
jgi:hypothetical protein